MMILLPVPAPADEPISWRDPVDGRFDVTDWLMSKTGFLPVPLVITEPALELGGGLGILYFHPQVNKVQAGITPDMSGALFWTTGNGSVGGGAFHMGFWREDSIRFVGALIRANLNINLYAPLPSSPQFHFNSDAWIAFIEAAFRFGDSSYFLGPRLVFFLSDNTINEGSVEPGQLDTNYLGVGTVFSWDTRDTVFTPNTGRTGELQVMYALPAPWEPGRDYWPVLLSSIKYQRLSPSIVLGDRFGLTLAFGNVPIYARPAVVMRGVPAGTAQDDAVFQFEPELRFILRDRWSLLVFGGIALGLTNINPSDPDRFDPGDLFPSDPSALVTDITGSAGIGFRYEMSRVLGLSMGMDLAVSNRGWAFYFITGTAW